MTDLNKLYAIIDGKTPGPWRFKFISDAPDRVVCNESTYEIDLGDETIHNTPYYNSAPQRLEDARFIAAIGTVAPELKELIQATEALDREETTPVPDSVMRRHCRARLHVALAKLKTVVREGL